MPTLPRTVPNSPPAGAEARVFASRFGIRTLGGALRFLVRTPAVRRQGGRAPGAYGATLGAQPLRRTFWTLSAWESAAALKEFARSGAHRRPPADVPGRGGPDAGRPVRHVAGLRR
ncbi:hypothetical protein GCM10010345_29470 [Streptomyces canarius]|uniref:DUF3291 domain-containing protein n=1 Tax=Streptomyces canarius TaxID=285453 RepID=A0ABQ3CPG9_9ACTN|nr:hypothetical protein GCM10010345_29470 [Streptomyces canarius]